MKNLVIYAVVLAITFWIGYKINDVYLTERAPAQPIEFSHRIHAGDNSIPCLYCHSQAERSRVAGVPNVKRCMGCHNIIKTDAPEGVKLSAYWEKKEPIPWILKAILLPYRDQKHACGASALGKINIAHGDVAGMS